MLVLLLNVVLVLQHFDMAYRGRKRDMSESRSKGVGYFDHFPKNFLRPYGATTEPLEDSTIYRRLIPSCCEYLKRPKIAFSELAGTVSETIDTLETMEEPLLDSKELKRLKKSLKNVNESLSKLNVKHNPVPNENEVKQTVRSLLEPNDELDKYLRSAYMTGCNLTTLSTQLLVAKALLKNPNEYGRLVQASDNSDKDFKIHKDFKSLKSFLIKSCTRKLGVTPASSTSATTSRTLLEMFDSSDEEDNDSRPRKRRREQPLLAEQTSDNESQNVFVPSFEGDKGKEKKSKSSSSHLEACETKMHSPIYTEVEMQGTSVLYAENIDKEDNLSETLQSSSAAKKQKKKKKKSK